MQYASVKLQFKGNTVFPGIRTKADSHCFYRHRQDNDRWIVTIGVGGKNLKSAGSSNNYNKNKACECSKDAGTKNCFKNVNSIHSGDMQIADTQGVKMYVQHQTYIPAEQRF